MVRVQHLTKSFTDDAGRFDVIRDASFSIVKGEMVSLVGPSGAGKTTLLQILGGLDRPTSGSVEVGGRNISSLAPADLAAFRNFSIGFVFQFHHLLPDFTAMENVVIPGMIAGQNEEAVRGTRKGASGASGPGQAGHPFSLRAVGRGAPARCPCPLAFQRAVADPGGRAHRQP